MWRVKADRQNESENKRDLNGKNKTSSICKVVCYLQIRFGLSGICVVFVQPRRGMLVQGTQNRKINALPREPKEQTTSQHGGGAFPHTLTSWSSWVPRVSSRGEMHGLNKESPLAAGTLQWGKLLSSLSFCSGIFQSEQNQTNLSSFIFYSPFITIKWFMSNDVCQ